MWFVPGNPAQIILGSTATPEEIAYLTHQMGLDRPYMVQLLEFLSNTFLHGDLGTSYSNSIAVSTSLLERFPRTLTLASISILITVVIGIPLGIIAATHQGKWQDYLSVVLSMVGISLPGFWLALMMIVFFCVKHRWLPPYGIGSWKNYVIPIISNSLHGIAMITRQCRTDVLEVIRSDYVTTARAKGVSEHNTIYKHVMPNALIPLITSVGSSFAHSLGGTVITESIFTIPGIGLLMTNAINSLDYPVVRGGVVVIAIAFSFVMLIVDLIYAMVDPRIKAQYVGK